MQIQAYLTAATINLKRLASALLSILTAFWRHHDARSDRVQRPDDPIAHRLVALAEFAAA